MFGSGVFFGSGLALLPALRGDQILILAHQRKEAIVSINVLLGLGNLLCRDVFGHVAPTLPALEIVVRPAGALADD